MANDVLTFDNNLEISLLSFPETMIIYLLFDRYTTQQSKSVGFFDGFRNKEFFMEKNYFSSISLLSLLNHNLI